MRVVGDNDWGNTGYGWNNKPHAPFSHDQDREKNVHPVKS